jgi:hypothetical protein
MVRLSSFVEVVVNVIGLYVVRFNNHPLRADNIYVGRNIGLDI